MDKIRRLAARLGGAKPEHDPDVSGLAQELDRQYESLLKTVVGRLDDRFDAACFAVAVLDACGLSTEAKAVSGLLWSSAASGEAWRGHPSPEGWTEPFKH